MKTYGASKLAQYDSQELQDYYQSVLLEHCDRIDAMQKKGQTIIEKSWIPFFNRKWFFNRVTFFVRFTLPDVCYHLFQERG